MTKICPFKASCLHGRAYCVRMNSANQRNLTFSTLCCVLNATATTRACLPPKQVHLSHVSTRLARHRNTWSKSAQCTKLACRTSHPQRTRLGTERYCGQNYDKIIVDTDCLRFKVLTIANTLQLFSSEIKYFLACSK